ncbi:MocR-like pyridoxine biosynthesis transcription factor PdxR [Bacillus sp. T33-2]|uniref:MocR-like pyridoxine biosynthesis transcription factor PdxR n=1 Tax=Bacillus sp. T33-2 TaxID=2054168 RepID=UPI000C78817B|nr:PLP-dependent aminotransferase family protein [Bacillus sp. T33-2]PLR95053.1 GntR family transcriptional regulator [Bacillus sp. T33-2]
MIELTPVFENKSNEPLYIQLSNYIKQEIFTGRIRQSEKLPSKRKLSNHLGVSLNTIQAAYDQLCAEGYAESKARQGLFVTRLEDDMFSGLKYPQNMDTYQGEQKANFDIDFNSGKVDLANFPYSAWRKLTIQSLYEDEGDFFYNGDAQGELSLRNEISKYLFASRGVKCSPGQIVIGAGTQVLFGLLCMVIGKENTYALESPGFHRTRIVLQDQGVSTVPIPLDTDGIDVHQLKSSGANVVYVTPSHQFPLGMVMPISRRIQLLKWAEEKDGYIIEDDYDGEYRYKGKPIPSLQGLDSQGRVVYLGTFSKSLIPSIRISYLVLPPSLLEIYKGRFMVYKQTASRLHQVTLFHFMHGGHWHSHLNKMRTLYRKKQAALTHAIKQYMGGRVEVIGEKSGLHIVLKVKIRMKEEELINAALKRGVRVYPLSIYYDGSQDYQEPRVLLGFGGLSEAEMEKGIRLLKEAWDI